MNASNMHFDDRALVSYVMSCPLPTMSQKLKYKVSLNIYAPLPTPKSKSAQIPPPSPKPFFKELVSLPTCISVCLIIVAIL